MTRIVDHIESAWSSGHQRKLMQRATSRLQHLSNALGTGSKRRSSSMSFWDNERFKDCPKEVKEAKGLHLITMSTPNGKKVQVGLEELKEAYGTEFTWSHVNIMTNRQKEPWFLALNHNGRIPVLLDATKKDETGRPFLVMETAAILLYLAKEHDSNDKFGFKDEFERNECLQWMFFGHGGIGPMQGQLNHFGHKDEKIEYAIKRYHDETLRLYGVLDGRLSGSFTGGPEREYLAGKGKGKYSWADISIIPWVAMYERSGIEQAEMDKLPHLQAWIKRCTDRPAAKRGFENYAEPGSK
ncbi:uncharacterized protein L969DRAFT_15111 [Mixia osmundae IAM 14324]|uniref:Glutathione S-transferase n=1 Tax=Mixia osmundae (strain CBS 9802 / IAM 14324 / JCM 22182 / KY 12970) TaxID=764103 RepID=G7DTA4_MIXOS|nr:uncharacterized protein L969DRAFT_15111 [Mixia osmundae IAM 14324]KEI42911.1 hypothetical protein L969DRAFT_15111 [Mixia osmundae IAM 14324]GAA93751.1 hypothetical protein E5Q_00397 [Mixia osmundae IAM 14324]